MPPGLSVADCACSNLRKATRAVTRLFDEALRPAGLRATQFSVLQATAQLEPVTVTRLADVTVTDRTTLTRNLKLLERQGLIRIEAGADRRERAASLTRSGRDALRRAYPRWQRAQAQVVAGLSEARWHGLLAGLAAVVSLSKQRRRPVGQTG